MSFVGQTIVSKTSLSLHVVVHPFFLLSARRNFSRCSNDDLIYWKEQNREHFEAIVKYPLIISCSTNWLVVENHSSL